MCEQGRKSEAVQGDGERFPQYDNGGEGPPRNGGRSGKETKVVIRGNREEDQDGEPTGEPPFFSIQRSYFSIKEVVKNR